MFYSDPTRIQDLLEGLNEPQCQAVTSQSQYLLVLAGAGTGKTRVLTHRMAWLIQDQGYSPFQLMAVTFTNKAAKEMKNRVSDLIGIDARNLWVGTFHGLSNRILRIHAQEAGLKPQFQIMDMGDQLSFIKRLMKDFNIDTETYKPKDLQYFINDQKEQGLRAEQSEDTYSNPHFEKMKSLYVLYQERCESEGVVDFGELLLRSYELITRNENIRQKYQQHFAHILVDEFQDTNDLQYRWLQLIAGTEGALFAVGDDDQSIYAFRGARVENLFDFERRFAKGSVVRLEQNYRSNQGILEAANAIISHNKARLGKELWSDKTSEHQIYVVGHERDFDEARYVVNKIDTYRQSGVHLNEMAILYRSNAQSRLFEQNLVQQGIAYRVYGGMRFFDRQEVKNALAYLRLLGDPHNAYAFLRVVNFPPRGIGARTIEQLTQNLEQTGQSYYDLVDTLKLSATKKLQAFKEMVQKWTEQAHMMKLSELLAWVINDSGMRLYYQNQKESVDRLDNLDELVYATEQFCREYDLEGYHAFDMITFQGIQMRLLDAFLSHVGLEPGERHVGDTTEDAVQLMSVHASKGLEFQIVFIVGLEEGLFPHANNDMPEEERRLMYVAITRAKDELYLNHAGYRRLHNMEHYSAPSEFLLQLPEHLIQQRGFPVHVKSPKSFGVRRFGQLSKTQNFASGNQIKTNSKTVYTSQNEHNGYHVGQQVSHAAFGKGTIVSFVGSGESTQVKVAFKGQGVKTLKLSMAKLMKLS